MTVTHMDFSRNERDSQHNLRLDKGSADALADLCRKRWPAGTAKLAAKEWNLTVDEARGVVAGRASRSTIDKIYKRGGPPVFLAVLEEVWGQSLARYFTELREAHDEHGRRLAAVFGSGGPVAGDRSSGHSSIGRSVARMGDAAGNRTSQRTR